MVCWDGNVSTSSFSTALADLVPDRDPVLYILLFCTVIPEHCTYMGVDQITDHLSPENIKYSYGFHHEIVIIRFVFLYVFMCSNLI